MYDLVNASFQAEPLDELQTLQVRRSQGKALCDHNPKVKV